MIAANPFASVPLYEPDIIQQYSGKRRGELEPHLFAIAEDAYRCMVREKSNQTVVVSGERYLLLFCKCVLQGKKTKKVFFSTIVVLVRLYLQLIF